MKKANYKHDSGATKRKKAAFLAAASDPKQSKLNFLGPKKQISWSPSESDNQHESSKLSNVVIDNISSSPALAASDVAVNMDDQENNDCVDYVGGVGPSVADVTSDSDFGVTEDRGPSEVVTFLEDAKSLVAPAEGSAETETSASACVTDVPMTSSVTMSSTANTITSAPTQSISTNTSESTSSGGIGINVINVTLETRHVPQSNFQFPKSKDGRSCVRKWFDTYKWLHYVEDHDHVICFTCLHAQRLGKTATGRGNEQTFAQTGFKFWKKAVEKFKTHESSKYHHECAEFLVNILKRESVGSLLSVELKKSQADARTAYKVVLSSLRYLARSGQPIRGAQHYSGNFIELLEERALECPELQEWLKKKDNWLSGDIQNEILEIMAHEILHALVRDIQESQFYSLMADGTTDITGDEQLSICFRYVQKSTLDIHEVFVGLYCITSGTASSIKMTIFDVMKRLGLSNELLRGHCFDGAAAMSGRLNGVQKLITDEQPKAIFIHCSNHALDLVIQEIAKQCDVISDSLTLVKEISKAIMESAKRKNIYDNIVISPCIIDASYDDDDMRARLQAPTRLRTVCPTRWCVRAAALKRFLENYLRVRKALEIMLKDEAIRISDDRRASLRGFLGKMGKFSTVMALKIALHICEPAEHLAKALQKHNYTAIGAKKSAQALYNTYASMNEVDFERLWSETDQMNEVYELDLIIPEPPRRRVLPLRRRHDEHGGRAPPVQLGLKEQLRKGFVSVLDWVKSELNRRFDQPGMIQLVNLERILFSGGSRNVKELGETLGVHASDFDVDKLCSQLKLADTMFHECKTLQQYTEAMKCTSAMVREDLLDQVKVFVMLLLTVPATSTSCECSFSGLKRLKTYIRSTMQQKRLTHLLVLHIHKDRTLKLSLDKIMSEFVSRNATRRKTFGLTA